MGRELGVGLRERQAVGVRLPETSVEGVQAARGKQGRHCNAQMIGGRVPVKFKLKSLLPIHVEEWGTGCPDTQKTEDQNVRLSHGVPDS